MTTTPERKQLREYQWDGVRFLAGSDAGLLADEMGLGKTVQVAVALRATIPRVARRVLVVAPASLRLNWERELRLWSPEIPVRRVIGDELDRAATYRLPVPVLIASYEQIRVDAHGAAGEERFDLVVLDEAQRIKNPDSNLALACRLLRRDRAWALSGTPLENQPQDIVSIFQFLRPGLINEALSRAEIHSAIQPHFLRRTKSEVLSELPPVIEQVVPLEMGGHQRRLYDDVWLGRRDWLRTLDDRAQVSRGLFALLTRLKQVCNHDVESGESVKLEMLRLILEERRETDDKLLIFSQYVETLRWLAPRLNMPNDVFHGGLSEIERDDVLRDFRDKPGPRALLVSLRAGGVDLNLNAATVVVLFDRWWNPAVENQAVQRAHRFGREAPLHVFKFVVADSVEERIQSVLAEKDELFDLWVEGAPDGEGRLSRAALRMILGLTEADLSS